MHLAAAVGTRGKMIALPHCPVNGHALANRRHRFHGDHLEFIHAWLRVLPMWAAPLPATGRPVAEEAAPSEPRAPEPCLVGGLSCLWVETMWTIRRATLEDIEVLTDLRQRFLTEIGHASDAVPGAVRSYFAEALPTGEFVAFVAECDGRIVATSGVQIFRKAPHAHNLSGKEGFVLNMFTLPEWRGRGVATALMRQIVAFVCKKGATCIRLHASQRGLGLYTKLGFRHDNSEMVLYLNT